MSYQTTISSKLGAEYVSTQGNNMSTTHSPSEWTKSEKDILFGAETCQDAVVRLPNRPSQQVVVKWYLHNNPDVFKGLPPLLRPEEVQRKLILLRKKNKGDLPSLLHPEQKMQQDKKDVNRPSNLLCRKKKRTFDDERKSIKTVSKKIKNNANSACDSQENTLWTESEERMFRVFMGHKMTPNTFITVTKKMKSMFGDKFTYSDLNDKYIKNLE